ncbi:NADH dehydrogenase [ubiquinone] 1 alpha subcomplex assembly factor 3-like [Limulus polyphemus]|uniref:NADH dehydrogenase [ubiquinone] 1 alpha subcomplex assembly factor 3 n=1 Tax=Limulus polyphemus TaxID=6850 RepID=A0ABM1BKK5_LIMPO|nr:NADH dehydrogenase [ubiquinone] 1 alpha subcomplex assembly factor 3-like [Limulus polyphemus]
MTTCLNRFVLNFRRQIFSYSAILPGCRYRSCFTNKKCSIKSKLESSTGTLTTSRHYSYEGDGKTTVTILNKEEDEGILINSYSTVGFRLNNGIFIFGPVAVFPRSVLQWNVKKTEDINPDSLSLFYLLEPKIDLLIIGTGGYGSNKIDYSVIKFMASKKINMEILPTYQACSTFNFLNAEHRSVAAALIPPETINYTDDDVVQTQTRLKSIYETDDDIFK